MVSPGPMTLLGALVKMMGRSGMSSPLGLAASKPLAWNSLAWAK